MDDNGLNRDEDDDEVRAAQRATTGDARQRAGAPAGVEEPAASEEADEPTTAAADRVRLGADIAPNRPVPPSSSFE